MCREKGGMPHAYDMVVGPTADDDTAFCLKAYWDGLYGKVGTDAAKGVLLNKLETENLGIQYYIGKQEVADRFIVNIKTIEWRSIDGCEQNRNDNGHVCCGINKEFDEKTEYRL